MENPKPKAGPEKGPNFVQAIINGAKVDLLAKIRDIPDGLTPRRREDRVRDYHHRKDRNNAWIFLYRDLWFSSYCWMLLAFPNLKRDRFLALLRMEAQEVGLDLDELTRELRLPKYPEREYLFRGDLE